ncbi:MAG TPA: molybdopterin-dependent oxidoreductase [Terriglobia bacterium]|nr:molybdopterin-dependent oxidoreductase [Terriglobia bacterium]
MKKVVHAACPHDCPDACGVLITVEDGRATKIQGDPAHPVTRGFLCAKVAKYLDRVYSPDRVLYPMRRVAPKGHAGKSARATQDRVGTGALARPGRAELGGEDIWQRISWDEALETIAAKFRSLAQEFGSESILPYSYGGTLGKLGFGSMDRRFFHRLGASQLARTICAEAGAAGIKSVYGVNMGTEPEQFAKSKYIIAWAANIHGNNIHLWPFIEEARRNGAKLVVIDPYRTRTAACADWHIPINPGTDLALALGMMHVIFNENLHDEDYLEHYTTGSEELRKKVEGYPPEKVAQWTGLSVADVLKLAREYATTRPSIIRLNYGVQRSQNGGMATRAIAMLPCIIGSWKEVGGGLQLSTSGAYGLNNTALERPDLMEKSLGRPARTINMVELGKALNDVNEPPVKALFVYNSNPAAVCPNHNEVIRGLMRPDLFTVVHDQFFTDTTDYADMVLPATTFFEHKELQSAYGHYYLQMSNQAIDPLGECRSNVEVFRGLAEKMGFGEDCFRDTTDEMMDQALQSPNPWLKGLTRERLEQEGQVRLNFGRNGHPSSEPFLPYAAGGFRTTTGKAELYSESLKAQGLDPVAEFVPPDESRHTASAKKFPLELLARKADNFLNSTFTNLPSLQSLETKGLLEMHTEDAGRRGIRDGDLVRVYNSRGEIQLKAKVNGSVSRGVVAAKLNWAKLTPGGRNINVLTSEKLSDMGNSATFYSVLVEVEAIQPIP